jgi:hypothetical protein
MHQETNLLRARAKRFVTPVLALALVLFAGAFAFGHKPVDAATTPDNTVTPINNASIDPLLARNNQRTLREPTETIRSSSSLAHRDQAQDHSPDRAAALAKGKCRASGKLSMALAAA